MKLVADRHSKMAEKKITRNATYRAAIAAKKYGPAFYTFNKVILKNWED